MINAYNDRHFLVFRTSRLYEFQPPNTIQHNIHTTFQPNSPFRQYSRFLE
jgi:hypothetical protein